MSKIKFLIILILGLAAIFNLSRTLIDVFGSGRRLEGAKVELKELEEENEQLKEEIKYVGTAAFVEKEAREKLNLIMPGEKFVLVVDELEIKSEKNDKILGDVDESLPVWKQWVELLLD